MARLIIFGAGGCGGDLLRAARHCYGEVAYADDKPRGGEYLGHPLIHPEQMRDNDHFTPAVGDGTVRARLIERFARYQLATLIAPTAIIGPGVEIGDGAQIHDLVILTSRNTIGRNCQINVRTSVGHDVVIGDHVTIGPHVGLGGYVQVESFASFGFSATVRPDGRKPIRIGRAAKVGCGAVVMHDVPDGATVAGNPARPLREWLRAAR